MKWRNVTLNQEGKEFSLPPTNTLEISIDIQLRTAANIVIGIKDNSEAPPALKMSLENSKFRIGDTEAPVSFTKEREFNVRIFLDRSVLEVFVNGTACATKVIPPLNGSPTMEVHAVGGEAKGKLIEIWPIKSIW